MYVEEHERPLSFSKLSNLWQEAEAEYGEEEEKGLAKLEPEERRTRFLQRVLLDYLTVTGGEENANAMASRHFYISQW